MGRSRINNKLVVFLLWNHGRITKEDIHNKAQLDLLQLITNIVRITYSTASYYDFGNNPFDHDYNWSLVNYSSGNGELPSPGYPCDIFFDFD